MTNLQASHVESCARTFAGAYRRFEDGLRLRGHRHYRIGGFLNITFVSDDVEATAKILKDRGVEFVQEPQKADWGTAAIFQDPDGNKFVLSTP